MLADTKNDIDAIAQSYERDGAAVVRGVVSPEWIARMGAAIDGVMAEGRGIEASAPGNGRFFGDMYTTLNNAEFAAFVRESGLAELAGKIMRVPEVRFFYDQLLVKEPGTTARTPWHQDLPYWPVRGEHILSIWVPFDKATPENGVVTYVRGSHLWNRFFPTQPFAEEGSDAPDSPPVTTNDAGEEIYDRDDTLSDLRRHPEKYELLTWNLEPGDVLIHHPLVVHGAPGNLSSDIRRRALATRWFGEDVRWDDTRPHFLRIMGRNPAFPSPKLETGEYPSDPLFPVIWPKA